MSKKKITNVLAGFLPLTIKGISMNDGSISFGPSNLKIVLGYITNAISFGDFVSASLGGRKDFGAPDTAVTQMACAEEIVRAANCFPDLLEAAQLLEKAESHHANCKECEGEEVPELCAVCFPFFDDARIKRRLAIAKATGAKS